MPEILVSFSFPVENTKRSTDWIYEGNSFFDLKQ